MNHCQTNDPIRHFTELLTVSAGMLCGNTLSAITQGSPPAIPLPTILLGEAERIDILHDKEFSGESNI